jgi:hypothetical protein
MLKTRASQVGIPTVLMFFSLLLLVAGVGTASASTFTFNFNTGIPTGEWSGHTNLESVQGYAGLGSGSNVFNGYFLRNETGGAGVPQTPTILTLTGLPAHNSVSLGFLLAVIDSWDGGNPHEYSDGPDYFNVRVVDGNNIWTFSQSFSNFTNVPQSYIPPTGVQLERATRNLGFDPEYYDSAYDMGLDPLFQNIPHTANILQVEWFASGDGWQGYNVNFGRHDESWAIDNVRVDLNPVPLPSTVLLLGSGLAGLAVWRKRRSIVGKG